MQSRTNIFATADSHAKLLRAGFLRQVCGHFSRPFSWKSWQSHQAYPGVFHVLPLGRRVLDKLEALIDKHMYNLGKRNATKFTVCPTFELILVKAHQRLNYHQYRQKKSGREAAAWNLVIQKLVLCFRSNSSLTSNLSCSNSEIARIRRTYCHLLMKKRLPRLCQAP